MKYVITNKDDVVIHISETIGYQENGNVIVKNGELAIAKPLVKEVYEVEEIEENVEEAKYCYTKEKGFYKNENYKEIITPEKEIEILKEQVTDLQLALTEIYESGV